MSLDSIREGGKISESQLACVEETLKNSSRLAHTSHQQKENLGFTA